jgi:hypothetical protein
MCTLVSSHMGDSFRVWLLVARNSPKFRTYTADRNWEEIAKEATHARHPNR